jgi:hypothetical protein
MFATKRGAIAFLAFPCATVLAVSALAQRETAAVLKHAVSAGKLTIVEACYSLDTGLVTKLR